MSTPIPIPKHSPWKTQILVIRALFKREIAARFGKYQLGFFWMLLEPLIGVIVIGLVIGPIVGRAVIGIPYGFFLLNSFLLLRLFTGTMNAGVSGISSDQGLLVYPTVKPIDPVLARFIYNLVTTLFSFVLFCIAAMWMGITISLNSLHILLITYLITWLTGCGFGFIFVVAAAHYNEVEKIVKFLQRPLLFLSAGFFPTYIMPTEVREILFYNPLVHSVELSRQALFPMYQVIGANLLYPSAFAVVVLSIGITYFRNNPNLISKL